MLLVRLVPGRVVDVEHAAQRAGGRLGQVRLIWRAGQDVAQAEVVAVAVPLADVAGHVGRQVPRRWC